MVWVSGASMGFQSLMPSTCPTPSNYLKLPSHSTGIWTLAKTNTDSVTVSGKITECLVIAAQVLSGAQHGHPGPRCRVRLPQAGAG